MRRDDPNVKRHLDKLVDGVGRSHLAAAALFATDDDNGVSRFILEILTDPAMPSHIVVRALWFVPLFSSSELIAAVGNLIKERPALARLAAASLRGTKAVASGPDAAAMVLDRTLSSESRLGAMDILRRDGDSQGETVLRRLLREGADLPEILVGAARTIAFMQMQSKSFDAIEELSGILRSPSPDVRFSALTSLGNVGARRAIPAITALLKDATQTSSGDWVDAEAARVIRLLRGDDGGENLSLALRASYAGAADDWSSLRDLCDKFRARGSRTLVRRLESAQFMMPDEITALSLNYLGVK